MSVTDNAQWHSAGATTGGERRDGRVPPHNLVAEESLLGAMLLSRDAIADVLETVSAVHFYRPAHARVFEAVHGLYSAWRAGRCRDGVGGSREQRLAGGHRRSGRPAVAADEHAGHVERGLLCPHSAGASHAASPHRGGRRDRGAGLRPSRRCDQGCGLGREPDVPGGPGPGGRQHGPALGAAGRDSGPPRRALRARRVDHRHRHRLQRPRQAAVGLAAQLSVCGGRQAVHGQDVVRSGAWPPTRR